MEWHLGKSWPMEGPRSTCPQNSLVGGPIDERGNGGRRGTGPCHRKGGSEGILRTLAFNRDVTRSSVGLHVICKWGIPHPTRLAYRKEVIRRGATLRAKGTPQITTKLKELTLRFPKLHILWIDQSHG